VQLRWPAAVLISSADEADAHSTYSGNKHRTYPLPPLNETDEAIQRANHMRATKSMGSGVRSFRF